MSMTEFYQTKAGRELIDRTLPSIARSLERIADTFAALSIQGEVVISPAMQRIATTLETLQVQADADRRRELALRPRPKRADEDPPS